MSYQKHKSEESVEDYLETILILNGKLANVRSIDIANELGYSKPSVSIAMKKLRESAYIEVDSGGYIRLLPPGAEIAERIYKRHQTLTEFFVYLGVSRGTADEDACKVEHDLSSETFSKIKDHVWKTMGLDGAKKAEN